MKKWVCSLVFSAVTAATAACGGGGGGDDDPGMPAGNQDPPGQQTGGGGATGGSYMYRVAGALDTASYGGVDKLLTAGFPDYRIGEVIWAERDHLYLMPPGSGLADVKAVADTLPGNFTRFDGDDCYLPADIHSELFLSRNIRKAEICFDMERGMALIETEIEAAGDVTEAMMNAVFGDISGTLDYPLGAIQIDRKFPANTDVDAYTNILRNEGFDEHREKGEVSYLKAGNDGNSYFFEYEIEGDGLDAEWVVYR
jgi:hypothetical protein